MKRLLVTFVLVSAVILSLALAFAADTTLAQRSTPTPTATSGRATPTPTATPSGGGGGGKREPTSPPPLMGGVQGFVFNYSNGLAPEGGVPVVLDGGGWQVETVTDSNGFYRFAGLGNGPARLSLRLPPGAHEVAPMWPVNTGEAASTNTNLGLYWGDNPPLPVTLSLDAPGGVDGAGQPFELVATVHNRSGGDATHVVLKVNLPAGFTALEATANSGEAETDSQTAQLMLDSLPTDQTATLTVQAQYGGANPPAEGTEAEALLTYLEQPVVQRVALSLAGGEAKMAAAAPAETPTPAEVAAQTTAATPQATAESLIPTTGGSAPSEAWPGIVLSLLFLAGLGIAGFRAFRHRRA